MGSKWVELLREMAPVDQKKKGGFPIFIESGALGFTPPLSTHTFK
jgi:hypothetical protein